MAIRVPSQLSLKALNYRALGYFDNSARALHYVIDVETEVLQRHVAGAEAPKRSRQITSPLGPT